MIALLLVLACARDTAPQSTSARHETVVTGLYVPWALAFAPDGRLFVTERPGRIRVISNWQLDPEPWAQLDIAARGESGLMGLALSPDFAQDGRVYVAAAFAASGGGQVTRVIRFTERAGRGTNPEIIVDGIPAAGFHAGTSLSFGPDGMLYVGTGDAGDPGSAQQAGSRSGKILRYTPDGRIPPDNPTRGSPVFALGVRNAQGLAWSPAGQLFATDHGPSGFPNERLRRNHDELNAIVRGGNYGWPAEAGKGNSPGFIPPLVDWTPAIAPAGVAVYSGPHSAWAGSLFVSGLRGRQLRRVTVEKVGRTDWRVVRDEVFFHEELGRIRAVAMGPDGFIYFTTSNWDGRGRPGPQDDRILRLIPE